MNNRIEVLDCTLRDGCYIVDSNFGETSIRGIIGKLQDAGIDLIECGWLKNIPYTQGSAYYHVPKDLEQYLEKKDSSKKYVAMIDWDRYDVDNLPPYDGKSIDMIRVVFPYGRFKEGIEIGKRIREKGYDFCLQAANTLAYNDNDLEELAAAINESMPVSISVVDTFGAMFEDDLDRIVSKLDAMLKPEITMGYHSHNNQQLAFSNTIHFIKLLQNSNRKIMVDCSLCGMGRGAGNATTELIVSYLNRKCDCHYDLDAIMDAIDTYMGYFKANYTWGYSTPYFIAGTYCCHVNNIAYLLKNHRTNAKDMRNIIESLSPEDRRKYDYELLEEKYLANQGRYVDDAETCEKLKAAFSGKTVVLIAPGKKSIDNKSDIDTYIRWNDTCTVAVNAFLPGYDYEYAFFVNPARYNYAKTSNPSAFKATSKIVLSNIKNEADDNEYIVGFNNAIRRGWEHFDNAVICALRLMDYLGVEKVAIAGFDGFKTGYNESYADPHLPTINPGNGWEKLNIEIKEMFDDFKNNAKNCKEITFITDSIFNE